MQKDGSQNWDIPGYVVRIAKKGSIVTNLKFVQKIMNGREGIQYVYQLDEQKALELEGKIKGICTKIGNIIDKNYNNGDVAIDLIIDRDLNIWILEMQQIYAFQSLKIINNEDLFHKVMTAPLKYAKALTNFSSSPNNNNTSHQ